MCVLDTFCRNKDQCRGWVGFSVKMAHRITAAADILLMPSRFEPCGLNQLYAMAYGTVPVVHAVGGLRDTVRQFNPFEDTGMTHAHTAHLHIYPRHRLPCTPQSQPREHRNTRTHHQRWQVV